MTLGDPYFKGTPVFDHALHLYSKVLHTLPLVSGIHSFIQSNGEVVVTTDDLGLEVADVRTRAAHCHKFKEKRARTNLLKYSMVHRTIPV